MAGPAPLFQLSAVALLLACAGCVPDDRRLVSEPSAPRAEPRAPAARPAASLAPPDPLLTAPFTDDFDRPALGTDWLARASVWRLQDGQVCAENARNQPAWLKRRLPVNARIEFDATTHSPEGDLRAEFWGDGKSGATGVSYTNATSYLTIFGGWKNSYHVLARVDEHAKDRPEISLEPDSKDLRTGPVEPGRRYRFKVERADGRTVRWWVDDIEVLTFDDREPLAGPGHEHFGFNDWAVRVCFDNLVITPLGAAP